MSSVNTSSNTFVYNKNSGLNDSPNSSFSNSSFVYNPDADGDSYAKNLAKMLSIATTTETLQYQRKIRYPPGRIPSLWRPSGLYSKSSLSSFNATKGKGHIRIYVQIPLGGIPRGTVKRLQLNMKGKLRSRIPEEFAKEKIYKRKNRKITRTGNHCLYKLIFDPNDYRFNNSQIRRKNIPTPPTPPMPTVKSPTTKRNPDSSAKQVLGPKKPICSSKTTFLTKLCNKIAKVAQKAFNLLKNFCNKKTISVWKLMNPRKNNVKKYRRKL